MMPAPGTNENPAVFPGDKREPGGPAACVGSRLVAFGSISFLELAEWPNWGLPIHTPRRSSGAGVALAMLS